MQRVARGIGNTSTRGYAAQMAAEDGPLRDLLRVRSGVVNLAGYDTLRTLNAPKKAKKKKPKTASKSDLPLD
jgi:hypothetical protein